MHTELATIKAGLQKLGTTSPIILMLIGYLDTLILLVYGQTPESAKEFGRKAAQTILIWIGYAKAAAEKTPSPLDDGIVSEITQACEAIAAT